MLFTVQVHHLVCVATGAGNCFDKKLVPVLQDRSAGKLLMVVLYPCNSHLTPRVRPFANWVCMF